MTQSRNVDTQEIEKFNAIAANWWDTRGDFKPLHQINPLRVNYILTRSDGIFGKKIVDVGCGGGILSESMAREGAAVTGIDMGEQALAVAKSHADANNIPVNYLHMTAEEHAAKHAGQYDIVTCMEMLEHVPNPASVIAACAALVKPGGQVFFSTLNRNPLSWLLAIVAAEYVLNLVPKGTHDHKKFIRPSELLRMAEQAGLQSEHMTGLRYNPLTDTYRLSQGDVEVNYIVQMRRPDA